MKTVFQEKQIDYKYKSEMERHKNLMHNKGWSIKDSYELHEKNYDYKFTVIYQK